MMQHAESMACIDEMRDTLSVQSTKVLALATLQLMQYGGRQMAAVMVPIWRP